MWNNRILQVLILLQKGSLCPLKWEELTMKEAQLTNGLTKARIKLTRLLSTHFPGFSPARSSFLHQSEHVHVAPWAKMFQHGNSLPPASVFFFPSPHYGSSGVPCSAFSHPRPSRKERARESERARDLFSKNAKPERIWSPASHRAGRAA